MPPSFHTMEAMPSAGLASVTTQAIAWCPHWWSHPEVVAILDALWIAWEGAAASPAPDAVLIWWDHATTMTHHLSDPTRGPMARCSSRRFVTSSTML